MLFTTLTTLGLATLAASAPQFQSRYERDLETRDLAHAVERGLVWMPRSLEARKKNSNNNDDIITITQLEETQLTVVQRGQEVQLTEIVEDKLVIIDQTKKNKDNIRKNHYKNRNSNVNTVVIVVTTIIDERDQSNVRTRYMTHQVQSNEEIIEQQIVIVSEAVAMTIGGSGSTGTAVQPASPTGTGSIAPVIMTYDPSAAPSVSNCTMILPAGVSAPSFDNTQVDQDPAIIIEENQAVFVEFVQSS
ncbi:hypothetical protein D0Z07_1386 [Hyphodiscus hymeniophilus]|uniref:Uncharacterized protein n=1 Tax=Hyphodiscus hymeniophilus TaxID=353542 RepID=A0A9P6VQR4_9HELO|nr:hypothetical protein D0Z07_1386 [Hyphodiscus hymeniophilus]